jgi:hypothetical protein
MVSVYVFKNRAVPPPPFGRNDSTVGTKADQRGFQMSEDTVANAWVMRGPVSEVQQVEHIAMALDLEQTEMDLDFVLVALSETWVNSYGLSAYFNEGASWLNSFQLDSSGAVLNFGAGDLHFTASLQSNNSDARIVSCPVVRAVTGEPWKFSADTSVPIAQLQRSEGVVSTNYEYREVGLGLEGVIRKAGDDQLRMEIKQRNGSIVDGTAAAGAPPSLREQVLETVVVVQPQHWSCVGGVRSWKTVVKKHLLGNDREEEQELLLIFCRPRYFLQGVPRAWPVGEPPPHLSDWGKVPWEGSDDMNPLLPPKPNRDGSLTKGEKEEIEVINRQLKIHSANSK